MSFGFLIKSNWPSVEAKQISSADHPACYVLLASPRFCVNTLCGMPGGIAIVMAIYNNKDILMVAYEDLPDEDKDVINKAMVEF
jgi:hypothetical protein